MKSINRIVLLALAAVAIVMFWLAPGINKATAVEYTRVYEDTDISKDTSKHEKEKKVKPPKGPYNPEEELKKKEYKTEKYDVQEKYPDVKAVKSKKVYKSEKIRPKDRKARLNAKMFSRAVHFVEEVPLDTAEAIVVADTIGKTRNF